MKQSIKTRLSCTIALVVLITVALTSFLANYFINKQFNDYIARKQVQKTQEIANVISQQYTESTNSWNMDFIYTIGMNALYEGFIIKVYDINNQIVWDAQAHDMTLCAEIMNDISVKMEKEYPQIGGGFESESYHFAKENNLYGGVSISYFSPFFLNDDDFRFLDTLNTIFLGIGLFSLVFSIVVGIYMAKRLSNPILKTVEATKQIAEGNYEVRMEEDTNTIEIDMLIHSINHLASSLEKQENLRKQLTEDVAHELRTPISILQSHLEALVDGVWQPSIERLQSCYDEVNRVGKLVFDLEKLANIDNKNLNLDKKEYDLLDIINVAINTFETEINNKNIEVTISGQATYIMADRDRITQVMVNLLSNAVKYSKEGSKIDITIIETKESVTFIIQDNGIGIPQKELPFIFERFYRADKSRNRMSGGSGIGLAIVKSIVEAHGGKIKVDSQIDCGSRFEIILPK